MLKQHDLSITGLQFATGKLQYCYKKNNFKLKLAFVPIHTGLCEHIEKELP